MILILSLLWPYPSSSSNKILVYLLVDDREHGGNVDWIGYSKEIRGESEGERLREKSGLRKEIM